MLDWFRKNASAEQQNRLQQLEYYAQSGRMLLRDDVGRKLGLHKSQQERLADLARETDEARQELTRSQFGDPAIKTLQAAYTKSMQAERKIPEGPGIFPAPARRWRPEALKSRFSSLATGHSIRS